jgi:ADP-dependent NAD(P)H-hydrate dehydratase / NAD(P)H-hydrate epimerase
VKLVTAAEMRALEEAAEREGTTTARLMENAGLAVAEAVRRRLAGPRGMRVVVIVGPGNNGGDGLVAARHLYDFGEDVLVYLIAPREGAPLLDELRKRELEVVTAGQDGAEARLAEALERADAVVDAVLGTGRARPLEGHAAAALDLASDHKAPVFAIDLPTGVNADTGEVDPRAASAQVTLALGFSKVGLHTLPGSRYTGEVEVLDIGLPAEAAESLRTELLTPEWVRERLPERPVSSNKGTFGRVLIVAGSRNFTGAAALTALGALRAGAGLVTLACIPEVRAAVAVQLPEATFLVLPEENGQLAESAGDLIVREMGRFNALVIGPGLGMSNAVAAVVRGVLTHPEAADLPAVVDADALNALARWPAWCNEIQTTAVLTPHPGELSRLSGESISELQGERLVAAERYSTQWQQTLVLKGAHTIIATGEGARLVSPFATAALATAGTGDVLAGMIGGYQAQGLAGSDAAGIGVFLHGAAALQYEDVYGESGLLASELTAAAAREAARLRRG